MIKSVGLFRRKPGMLREDFVRYYEEKHVPLVLSLMPQIAEYRRNYVVAAQDLGHGAASTLPIGFDVMTEVWFRDGAARDAMTRALSDPATYAR